MLIIGHRGNAYYPENTLKAFISALEIGDGIELDVQKTIDNVLVVSHDENLLRLAGENINIREIEFEKLKGIRVKGEPIPTLKEALELVKSLNKFVDIEVKNLMDFQDVIKLVKNLELKDFIISSFWHNGISEFKSLYPEIKFAYLYVHFPRNLEQYLEEVDFLKPNINFINESYLPYKDRVIVWTVDEEEKIRYIINMKIFGIISNFPDRVKKIMKGG